nr:alpha-hydroxy-acid oxidizing protein [Singulisphaera sp. GP187]
MAGGQSGVSHLLELIEAEMRVAMSLTGVTSVSQIDREVLATEL